MILQLRDNELLVSLKKFGVLSTPQILKLHFSSVAKTTALRRLRTLEASHFIRRAVPLDDGTNTWTIDYKGKTEMSLEERLQFSNRNTIKHDVLANDIRMKLEQLGLGLNWIPEYQLKADAFRNYKYKHAKDRLIPDGLMTEPMRGESTRIAIEVELTSKSNARYKRIFNEYKDQPHYQCIWYFVSNSQDLKKIYECACDTFSFDESRLFFSIITNFLKDPIPRVFPGQKPEWLPITRITYDNLNIKEPAHTPAQGMSTQEAPEQKALESTKSAFSEPNSLIPAPLRGGSTTPDPSPPTS